MPNLFKTLKGKALFVLFVFVSNVALLSIPRSTSNSAIISKSISNPKQPNNGFGTVSLKGVSLPSGLSGVLPFVSRTGNLTTYTAGSVIFSDGTQFTENNSNLFWDNANNRLGVGTNSPGTTLSVNGDSTFAGTLQAKTLYDSNDVKYWGAKGDGITDDTNAFKTALTNTNNLTISTPGTYLLSSPIYLKSGQHIKGTYNVILKKSISYSHVFANEAATTTGSTPDSNISIENVTIDPNNIVSTQTGGASKTAQGHLQFTYADNVKIKNVSIINGDSYFFGVHFQSVTNSEIEDYSYVGNKDGIHINGGSHDIVINRFYMNTNDDAIAIMTDDYPSIQHNAQDIRNIVIENGVSNDTQSPKHGFVTRFMTGSWLPWANGNSYNIGHVVVNAGNLYKMVNSGPITGTVAPTQTSGDSTGADGITWRWIGAGSNLNSNIYNIKFENIQIYDGRAIIRLINNDSYDHGEYPGTEGTSTVDGVYLTNVTSTSTNPIFVINDQAHVKTGLYGQSFIGNVGIGTTSPTNILSLGNFAPQKFWIEDSATDVAGKALTVAAGSTVAGTSVSNVAGGNLTLQSGLGTGTGASTILFQTGTTMTTGTTLQTMSTKMAILGNGNVGIGTATPAEILTINGSSSTGIRVDRTSGGNNYVYLRNGNSDTIPFLASLNNISGSATYGWGLFDRGSEGNFAINYRSGSTAWKNALTIQRSNGNVGIGTTSPSSLLDVSSSSTSTASAMIRNTSSSAGISGLAIKLNSTTLDNTSRFINFLDLNGTIIGKIQAASTTAVNYATNGTDFAEYFNKENSNDTFQAGDVVVAGNIKQSVTLTTTPYDSKLLGIVSAYPGFTGGTEGKDKVIIALTGQVPVNIDPNSEAINPGDPLTSSTTSGMAMKATKLGSIVAKAQESWTPGAGIKQIMAYVNISWFDPRGRATFDDQDMAGYALISAGQTKIDVKFNNQYQNTPVITATSQSATKLDWYRVTNESINGFTVEISPVQNSGVRFAWIAVPVKNAKITQ